MFNKGEKYRITGYKFQWHFPRELEGHIPIGAIVEVVREVNWAAENPSYICCGFSCPCCKVQILQENGKKSRKYYEIIDDLYEYEKID